MLIPQHNYVQANATLFRMRTCNRLFCSHFTIVRVNSLQHKSPTELFSVASLFKRRGISVNGVLHMAAHISHEEVPIVLEIVVKTHERDRK